MRRPIRTRLRRSALLSVCGGLLLMVLVFKLVKAVVAMAFGLTLASVAIAVGLVLYIEVSKQLKNTGDRGSRRGGGKVD